MPIPAGISTVTVTGQFLGPDGNPLSGVVKFYLPSTVAFPDYDLFVNGVSNNTLDASGRFTATLVATDNANISPSGWAYEVVESTNIKNRNYWVSLPTSPSPIDLSAIAPVDPARGNYVIIQGADGVAGPPGADGNDGFITRTASTRITDDNLSGLPSAPSWTIVQTTGGSLLKCSINASAGDRIRVCGSFMRNGSHFLDWALLNSAGAIARYAGSGTSTPLTEGNPVLYPSLSFMYVPGDEMFVVDGSHIDGTGKVTVALTHQGVASGIVYAHPTYPWRLRLENIGPEPA